MTINSLITKFKALDTDRVIDETLRANTGTFEALNKEQLKAGKTNTGEKIAPKYRSKKYAAAKAAMNPLPGIGTPDLYLTGSFYAGIDVEVSKDVFDIVSRDEKGFELEDKYPDIFGLGKDYKQEFLNTHLRPAINSKISIFTGLQFVK